MNSELHITVTLLTICILEPERALYTCSHRGNSRKMSIKERTTSITSRDSLEITLIILRLRAVVYGR